MAEMSPGTALRQLQQAQAGMRKARQALRAAREAGGQGRAAQHAMQAGWESLVQAHRLLAGIPLAAANDDVLTKQLAVQRYATALLVRLRRLARNETGTADEADDDFEDDV